MNTYKITVPRGTFNIRDRGNNDGFPLVMLHGWPESSYCWEAVTAYLTPSLRVIAPDLRGLGDSERTMDVNAYRKMELARDIVDALDALAVESFFLVGHDWGGIVAQEVALQIPNRVRKFVIMNIPVITNVRGRKEATAVMQSRGSVAFWYQYFQQQPNLPETLIRGNEEVWVRHFFGRELREDLISQESIAEYVRCYAIEHTPAAAASYYRTMRVDEKRWDTLGGVRFSMPSLYVYGSEDRVIIPEYLRFIEDCFDSIRVEYVKAGHFVQEEKPQEVATLLNEFLKE